MRLSLNLFYKLELTSLEDFRMNILYFKIGVE